MEVHINERWTPLRARCAPRRAWVAASALGRFRVARARVRRTSHRRAVPLAWRRGRGINRNMQMVVVAASNNAAGRPTRCSRRHFAMDLSGDGVVMPSLPLLAAKPPSTPPHFSVKAKRLMDATLDGRRWHSPVCWSSQ
jgi:hypothetical protein